MKAGAYVLHLTCDQPGCPRRSQEYIGENRRQAFSAARAQGWSIGYLYWTDKDYCKEHQGERHAKTR